jgi:Ca2+-transporting ATPase
VSTNPETSKEAAWHRLSVPDALARLETSHEGLSPAEVGRRREVYGPNELIDRGSKSPLLILWEQLTAVMVLLLFGAAGLSLVLAKFIEAGAILAIIVLFVALGLLQEYRAERAIAALRRLTVPNVRVLRNGQVEVRPANELVPGDIVLLEAGSAVPADLRLIEAVNLRIEEAALTGESEPAEKDTPRIDEPNPPLGDRHNLAFMGTQVVFGRGVGVVVATGMQTELGRIAGLIQTVRHAPTPLQIRIDRVGKQLAAGGVIVASIVVVIGLLAGQEVGVALLTAISVAVAVIPEGLPAVVTFTLALGAQRMLRRNALIRKLTSVETLGSVTVICSDKTGTLTQNRMTVTAIEAAGQRIELPTSAESWKELNTHTRLVLLGGALCNDAQLRFDGHTPTVVGDPTEGALVLAADRAGFDTRELRQTYPRVAELPFDSTRKRMSTVHTVARPDSEPLPLFEGATGFVVAKGSAESLLDVSTHVLDAGGRRPLDAAARAAIEEAHNRLAAEGLRVLGVAFRPVAGAPDAEMIEKVERDLTFVGLVGMIDPPRPEVRAAVDACHTAGIHPIMITGDHPLTAIAIARQLGIDGEGSVVRGVELEEMDEAQLDEAVRTKSVFARVSPEHKLRIVTALQRQREVVAMTGDGVNDAPALKKADIGVAMGITGTDVSKEAAAMVLRDDNFATIVAAVEEGRVIYDNLRRFITFAVGGNIGKVMVMLVWPVMFVLAGLEFGAHAAAALLPLQLLWLNLMTDGLLGLSMGVEKAEKNIMERPPFSPTESLFSRGLGLHTVMIGLLIGTSALTVGFIYYLLDQPQWQAMMFTTITFLQIFHAIGVRSYHESIFSIGFFSNRLMVAIIAVVVSLQFVILYTPFIATDVFRVEPLVPLDILIAVAVGSLTLAALEVEKAVRRTRRKRATRAAAPAPA